MARNLRAGVPFDALHLLTVLADDDPAILDRAFDALLDVISVVAAAGRERSSAIVVAAAAAAALRRAAIVVTVVPPASASAARGVAFVPAAVSVAEAAPVVPRSRPGLASDEAVLVVADDGAELVGGEIHGSPGAADHDGPVAALARAGLGLVDHDVGAGPVLQILDGVAAGADDDLGHLRGNFHLVLVPIVAAARGCSVARGVAARGRGVAGVAPAPAVVGGRRRAIVEAAAVAVSAAGGRRRASGIAGRRSRRGSAVGLVIPALAIVSAIVSAGRSIVSAAGRAVAARALRLGAVPVAAVESVIGAAIAEAGVGPVAPAPRARRGRTARVGRRRVRRSAVVVAAAAVAVAVVVPAAIVVSRRSRFVPPGAPPIRVGVAAFASAVAVGEARDAAAVPAAASVVSAHGARRTSVSHRRGRACRAIRCAQTPAQLFTPSVTSGLAVQTLMSGSR